MANNNSKSCARCGTSFICLPQDITNCQCNKVVLRQATRDYLASTNYDCLCAACLEDLDTLIEKAATHLFPKRSDQLKEGLHYYIENGYWVFTEFYHLLRGNCCGSGCRHCAYGNRKKLV